MIFTFLLFQAETCFTLPTRCTNKEIAEHLFITENTVKFHMRNLLRKTGCSRRKELLALFESIRSE